MAEKYYWLKLHRDFFKRHDVRIVEGMPNGKDYVLFYLKLLCESIDHDGMLRFSEQIPYNAEMLATITNTNIDIVRSAVKVLTQLGMMELMDDGTFFMNEVNRMIGSESKWAEKKRTYRGQIEDKSRTMSSLCPPIVRQEIEIEKEIEKDNNSGAHCTTSRTTKRFTKPSLSDVKAYFIERCGSDAEAEKFYDHYESNGWTIGRQSKKMSDWKASVRNWLRNDFNQPQKKNLPDFSNPYPSVIEEKSPQISDKFKKMLEELDG